MLDALEDATGTVVTLFFESRTAIEYLVFGDFEDFEGVLLAPVEFAGSSASWLLITCLSALALLVPETIEDFCAIELRLLVLAIAVLDELAP
jgi:hypothetical protein